VNNLLKEVKSISIPKPSAPSTKTKKAKPVGMDVSWAPIVPLGHTPYSWEGDEEDMDVKAVEVKNQPKNKEQKKANAKKNKQKAPKQKQPKQQKPASDTPLFARIDLRVGHVVRVFEHPDPEVKSLWCEEIDVGEDQPRQIASGLRKFYEKDQFQGKKIIVVCNLKPAKLKGFESKGMVLCASNEDHTKVELVEPPSSAVPGTRISLANLDVTKFKPDERVNPKKKKSVWLDFGPKLRTNGKKVACFDGVPMVVPEGECTVPNLDNCVVR